MLNLHKLLGGAKAMTHTTSRLSLTFFVKAISISFELIAMNYTSQTLSSELSGQSINLARTIVARLAPICDHVSVTAISAAQNPQGTAVI